MARRGPAGQTRSGDFAQVARQVLRIATGQEDEKLPSGRRESGIAGAKARKDSLTEEQRKEIAKKAANARWK